MKKEDIVKLIESHFSHNEASFKDECYKIAKSFNDDGDIDISEYLLSLLYDRLSLSPQAVVPPSNEMKRVEPVKNSLYLPDAIKNDITGLANAIKKKCGISKILFEGKPGTGKTETAKQLARILNRELYKVDFNSIIDSLLGQTSKNISRLFDEINGFPFPDRLIVLFDELDGLIMDRIDSNDHREMGRATSTFLKCLDSLSPNIVLIATTNLFSQFDEALTRRFDVIIGFDRYSESDLVSISNLLFSDFAKRYEIENPDKKLFAKIINVSRPLPSPSIIKTKLNRDFAFSNQNIPNDYLRRIFQSFCSLSDENQFAEMKNKGFSIRDISALTGISKSEVDRRSKK